MQKVLHHTQVIVENAIRPCRSGSKKKEYVKIQQ